jgi:hypothetical protein
MDVSLIIATRDRCGQLCMLLFWHSGPPLFER